MKTCKYTILIIISVLIFSILGYPRSFSTYANGSEIMETVELEDDRLKTPVKILIIGDSLIEWGFGSQLEGKLNQIDGITAIKRFKVSSGLNRIDYFNWFLYTQEIINEEKPDILIVYLGANDGQNIVADDGKAYTMDNQINWDNTYKKRVNDFLSLYSPQVKYIFWVGHPIPETERFYNYFIRMNPIYEEQCALFSNCIFVNSWDRFAINGKFVNQITDNNGNIGKTKSKDGVHLTIHGGNILSDLVIQHLSHKINIGEIKTINQYPLEIVPDLNSPASVSYSRIPDIFLTEDSKTTNLSNITQKDSTSIDEFTLEIKKFGKIIFTEPVDLSARELKYRFSNLDKYVIIENGKVEIDTEFLPQLDKKATIYLYNIDLLQKPEILSSDGFSKTKITNITLQNKVLTFETNGFSDYIVKPRLSLQHPPISTEKETLTIKGYCSDLSSKITVYSENVEVVNHVMIDNNGIFKIKVPLIKKDNNLKIIVTYFNGYQEEISFTVNKKGNLPPSSQFNILHITLIFVPLFVISTLNIIRISNVHSMPKHDVRGRLKK